MNDNFHNWKNVERINVIHFSHSVYNMAGVTCDCTWFYFLV